YDPRFESILCDIGLYQLRDALRLTTDPELITALVERWRPETNTFHLYHGEATITLEDMHFITGLTVDGLAVTLASLIPTEAEKLQDYVQNLLGKRPNTSDLSSGRIKMTWLHTNFTYHQGAIRDDNIETMHQYCRAYILEFFGSCIFADRSGAYANLFFLPLLDDLNRVGDYAWDRPHCHGSTESLVVPHFGLRAAPPTITLMTVEAGWRWSRCGLWRDSLL
ncbi:Serine/threonine-protein phosphatase 7 long form homolog, partial [Linum perenne]